MFISFYDKIFNEVSEVEKKKINLDKEKKVVSEFKEFISKGNIVDMAVGVIIGSAFGKIVTSLVNDIFMPLIGVIIGGLDFTSLTIKVGDAVISYGIFIQKCVNNSLNKMQCYDNETIDKIVYTQKTYSFFF